LSIRLSVCVPDPERANADADFDVLVIMKVQGISAFTQNVKT
jgi:hypothetical protein